MVFTVLCIDGASQQLRLFADKDTATSWLMKQSLIKSLSVDLDGYLKASDYHYDRMNDKQKAFGEKWLRHVKQLRQMGYGLPPSVEKAECNFNAIKRGEEV